MLNEFKQYLLGIGKSENTALNYCDKVKLYFKWCLDSFGSEPQQLYRANVLDYISYMKTIKRYYDYIFDLDYSCELVSDFDVVADFYRFYRAFKMYQVEIEDGILSVTNTDTWVTVQIIPGEGNQIWFQIK